MFQKFEYEASKIIDGELFVFRVVVVNINVNGTEYWDCQTYLSGLAEDGEAVTVKCFA
jgi:hypothetical protein